MEEWKEYKLGDLCSISSSKRFFANEYQLSGIPFYRGKEIIEKQKGEPITNELYISEDRFNEIKEKYGTPQNGDMLLTSVGTLGIPYIVKDEEFYFKDGNLTWFYNFRGINNVYLYYWFLSPAAQYLINAKAIGSTQKALTIDTLKNFDILLPPIEVQNQIVSILKSLDDKIEVNRRINENLEQQAQALFKSWFVDFEPFKDQPFVESELGLIPQGWRVFELGEIARLCAGGDKPLLISKTISDACKVPIYSNGLDDEGLYGYTDEDRIKEKSITVSARGTIGDVNLRLEPYCPIVRLISVIPNNQDNLLYIYYALRNKKIEGVGTTQQQLTVPNFKKEKILLPDKAIIFSFSECLSPIINYKNHIKNESRRLTELRDTLLPRLMSG